MNRAKMWYALAGLLAFVVVAVGWFALVSPQRDSAATLREQLVDQEARNAQTTAQVASLRKQAEGLPELKAKLAALNARVPTADEVPDLLRAITAQAADAGTSLQSVSPGTLVPPGGASAAGTGITTAGLATLPVQIIVTGDYGDLTAFVKRLESLPRVLLLNSVQIAEATTGASGGLTLTVQATAFVSVPQAAVLDSTAAADSGSSSGAPQ